jgi:hypothetical protein
MHAVLRVPTIRLAPGACALTAIALSSASAQTTQPATDSNTPLHLLKPAYPVPYGPTTV